MKIKKLLFVILILPKFLMGEIIETSQFEDVLLHVEQNASKELFIVCDIDNTLLRGSQHLGSVAWGDYMVAQLERKGISKQQAEEIENILWKTVQPYVKVKLVDPKTSEVIQEIQNRKISIVGLTARSPDEVECTTNQLLSLGIDLSFEGRHPFVSTTCLSMEDRDALYDKGILFSTPFNKKSSVLFSFFEKYSIFPECIIFIDDKRSHVEDIEKACKELNIHFVGIRFSAGDEHVKNFNPLLADIQWEVFPTIISDEQAERVFWSVLNLTEK